jgi:hypothetical protein
MWVGQQALHDKRAHGGHELSLLSAHALLRQVCGEERRDGVIEALRQEKIDRFRRDLIALAGGVNLSLVFGKGPSTAHTLNAIQHKW